MNPTSASRGGEGTRAPVRLAELLVGFSAVADLGMGLPIGEAARTAIVAVNLARGAGCPEPEVSDVFFAALLQHIGCTAYAHEVTELFADEFSIKRAGLATDFTRQSEIILSYLPRITRESPAGERFRTIRSALLHSRRMTEGYMLANCETASIIARRIGLPPGVCSGLLDIFEWWNGGGGPKKVRGEQISLVARLVNVAGYAVFFDRVGGQGAAAQAINQRSGGYLDPAIAADFQRRPRQLLEPTDAGDLSDRLLATEPRPHAIVEPAAMEEVLRVFGETVDLKTPFLHGHSAAVSALGGGACRALGLGDDQVSLARRVGYVQDIGRVAVPSAIWEHQGPLGSDAWMQVRLHAYHSEQILSRCAPLLPLAAVAGLHHDRLDGSGYHRGATAVLLSMTARVLAAADVRHALVSERPHRPAHPPHRASALLRAEANAGRLDHDAVRAVIAAAEGGGSAAPRARPAGLTDRQVEVLRLVARGLSNRAISEMLVISPRTAEHHVQDVYARIGVSSRAAAAMFAMSHGLLTPPQDW